MDPLREDNQRLCRALELRGTKAEERVYPGEPHAFHALIFRKAARQCWVDMLAFIDGSMADEA